MLKAIKGSAFANIASASRTSGSRQRPVEYINGALSSNPVEEQGQRNEADLRHKTERSKQEMESSKKDEKSKDSKQEAYKKSLIDVYI